jgi:type IV pilus assembly protein PilE
MKKENGFTLIELLVVIAIIGILASVVLPSYQGYVANARRADGQSALQGFAQAMERHYTTTGSYVSAAVGSSNTGAPMIFSTKSPIDGTAAYYNLLIDAADGTSYTIGAEPTGSQAGDGVLLLRSTGARAWDADNSAAGSLSSFSSEANSAEQCWKC